MQQAFVVLTGDRILGFAEVKDDRSILQDESIGSAGKKVGCHASERLGSHGRSFATRACHVCDD